MSKLLWIGAIISGIVVIYLIANYILKNGVLDIIVGAFIIFSLFALLTMFLYLKREKGV